MFMIVFSSLQLIWQLKSDSTASRYFIEGTVVVPAAYLANRLTPHFGAHAAGSHLLAPGGGLNIVNGCDGMETLFLLLAGFAAAPIRWRDRLRGIFWGVPLVYGLNQVRVLALFYAQLGDPELFDLLHAFIAPVIMVLAIAGYYYVRIARALHPPPAASP
jgi:exosortase/archaeosortase family protein